MHCTRVQIQLKRHCRCYPVWASLKLRDPASKSPEDVAPDVRLLHPDHVIIPCSAFRFWRHTACRNADTASGIWAVSDKFEMKPQNSQLSLPVPEAAKSAARALSVPAAATFGTLLAFFAIVL